MDIKNRPLASIIPVDEAIAEIQKSGIGLNNEPRKTHFFILGAGISYPSIPLSADIAEECKTFAVLQGVSDKLKPAEGMDAYSFWFEKAYPQPRDRKEKITNYTSKKPISHSNIQVAMILNSKRIANLVVTPNFDNQIARALRIFGGEIVISDHPATSSRINIEDESPQILHVHGSTEHYDICNLTTELSHRARLSQATSLNMLSTLDRIMENHSPIVIGYAGWSEDVIMKALKRRLEGRTLPYNLYWFLFRRESVHELPEWLQLHTNIKFVAPSESDSDEEGDDPKTLPASEVLNQFRKKFKIDVPPLMKDPIQFYISRLNEAFSSEASENDSDLIAYIESAKSTLNEAINRRQKDNREKIELLFESEKYEELYREVANLKDIDENIKLSIAEFMNAAARKTNDSELALRLIEKAKYLKPSELKFNITKAMLLKESDRTSSLELLKSISNERTIDEIKLLDVKVEYLELLYEHATELKKEERHDMAIDFLNKIVTFGKQDGDSQITALAIQSFNQLVILYKNQEKNYDQATSTIDDLITFAESNPPKGIYRRYVTNNLLRKARILAKQKNISASEEVYTTLIAQYQNSTDSQQEEHAKTAERELFELQEKHLGTKKVLKIMEPAIEIETHNGEIARDVAKLRAVSNSESE